MTPDLSLPAPVIIIGGGPAGLIAAEVVAQAGFPVALYDAMPSVGRKFLLAGVGGMNITHAEPHEKLITRYANEYALADYLNEFNGAALRDWIHGLGIETFVGTSGRVFPKDMKAAPLLRAWLHRLRGLGVSIYSRHRWLGWTGSGELIFVADENNQPTQKIIPASATLLALGGASWPRLGSNGDWVALLQERNISVNPLLPSNSGFDVNWSQQLREQFAGTPLHGIGLSCIDAQGQQHALLSEAIISAYGIEGTGVYALSRFLRESIFTTGSAYLSLDLLPDFPLEKIQQRLAVSRGKNSTSNFLRKQLHLPPLKIALLRELTDKYVYDDPVLLARAIKNLSVKLIATRPIAEAISSAGGVAFTEVNQDLMLNKLPGVFCAGEMLDWEAPTGGYLLTACFATGHAAGLGIVNYLRGSMVVNP